ncbi:pirin family protein [Litorivicinus sp.]|nr:pirin family protein [Litorivicinus sp.]MDB9862067.1 pirin family protein [Litorivicinus sp.]MDC1208225.1 pirin family protein [Litorivicinus sp.]MDC1240485.1 pirin family protein [Litorivicinus sp.]MDC1466082.1 pirin family protein [Litorivicinus sp.]|tara:strand:- start:7945 stop:8796 length:852 start_codon:yes stop_codon:yes gene_type:complete
MRSIARIIQGRAVSDGAGVNIRRVIGLAGAEYIDPFLMFDDFRNDDPSGYVAGFPPHPHRGFETVTYMVKGKMRHRDSNGNSGLLEDGAVQWMTAGRGILHSEMPEQTDGSLWGFQIWLNLPQHLQMSEPSYQDIPAADVEEFSEGGVEFRLVAGPLFGYVGPVQTLLPALMVDIMIEQGQVELPLHADHTVILFCFEGALSVAGKEIRDGELAILTGQGPVGIGAERGRGILLSAEPLNEPIARHGPFVLSTESELKQAFTDYQLGRLAPNQASFLASSNLE